MLVSQYKKYIWIKFVICHIVFDGYGHGQSIKDHEHQYRMTKKSVDIQVSGNLPAFANQTAFLANKNNILSDVIKKITGIKNNLF